MKRSHNVCQQGLSGLLNSIAYEESSLEKSGDLSRPEFIEELPEDYELKQHTNTAGAAADDYASTISA